MIGQQLRHYRIESLLGTGGMGSIYLAVHTQLGRKIAIKVIHPALARNAVVRERFRNEAAALSHLQHPHIVTLYDYSEEEDALYLFMEYVEGHTLDEYVRTVTGPVPEPKAAPMFAKLLDAVAYAHDRGVVHRDIKPSNIIVDDAGNAKILDFGIAKIVGQGLDGLTKEGTRMGTVLYMSPEQVRGEVLDKRSDVYSLGVTLFQVLTGLPPYDEATMTEYVVYQRILEELLPRMREIYPLVSDRMQAIVDRATAKDPAERFADCHQFRAALFATTSPPVATDLATPVYTTTPFEARPTSSTAWRENTISPTTAAAPRPASRRRAAWMGVLVAAGILFSIFGIVVTLLPDGPPNEQTESVNTTPIAEHAPAAETESDVEQVEEAPSEEVIAEPLPDTTTQDSQSVPVTPPETQQRAEQLAQIKLEYEAAPPSNDSATDTRFALRIVLTNTSSALAFDNVTLQIKFLSENDEVMGTYIYEHGHLAPGATERFNVERRVQAVRATCTVLSAQPVGPGT